MSGKDKKIILTGGGTAGHVIPNMALVPGLKEKGFDICYIGSKKGMEKGLVETAGLKYRGISTGKLRRYFDIKNFTDPFRVVRGFFEAFAVLGQEKPGIVFSKGGFVAVPVVLAAAARRIPVIVHESDMTPGLANRICIPFASRVCCNFPETVEYLPAGKALLTGSPIRAELSQGQRAEGLKIAGLSEEKHTLLVIGGSLGSVAVNNAVRRELKELLREWQIIHVCGRGNVDESLLGISGYVQYEYVDKELKHFFAAADLVISRAGAGVISELLALKKPNILIPLPKTASRGDQLLNAASFEKQGFSKVLFEEEIHDKDIAAAVTDLFSNREKYTAAMSHAAQADAADRIVGLVCEMAGL